MIYQKEVNVDEVDIDRYGRTLGIVMSGNININEEMLKAGLAWHYTYYDQHPSWNALEASARKNKKGLWSIAHPLAPWKFRKGKRISNKNR